MTLDTDHPELASEQAYVDHAYACLADMLTETKGMRFRGVDELEQQAFDRWKRIRVAALSDTRSALVFGRIDAGERHYIGRHHVREPSYETVVVDWRAPIAKAFYRAGPGDPMGLRRRRRFLAEGRELLGISDEHLDRDAAPVPDELLQRELSRRRGGHMTDVVATIQAEQDVVIRAPLEGIVVVQGGPGTGKTVVGLHRAAYLLYEHRRTLERKGVLVVGPNRVFVNYIEQVLPSLGEAAVTQLPVAALGSVGRPVPEPDPRVARLKGDVRMAEVVRRAIGARCRPLDDDVEIRAASWRFVLPMAAVHEEAQILRERGSTHRDGREALRDRLLARAYDAYTSSLPPDATGESYADVISATRKDRSFRAALDRVWPALTPDRFVADLFASPTRLVEAADGILTAEEQRLLRRTRSADWTVPDGPLVDEARTLIDGPPDRYGHDVADEAKDLSPMQLRMLARRCPEGSMTVLGDLGQATGAWAHDDWSEVLEHLPVAARTTSELTLGYRVSPAITELSSAILAEAAPRLRPPRSVRREPGEVAFLRVEPDRLATDAARAAARLLDERGTTALIAPATRLDAVREALREAEVAFADAERDLDSPLVLVPVDRAKGLEFESVVLVEPADVVAEGGLRLLYVAATRAMRRLLVLHADELPSCIAPATASTPSAS